MPVYSPFPVPPTAAAVAATTGVQPPPAGAPSFVGATLPTPVQPPAGGPVGGVP